MNRQVLMARVRAGLVCMLPLLMLTGCTPPPADTAPVVIELGDYTDAEVKSDPLGSGSIIGGHVLVDFEDSLSLSQIDVLMGANNLQRVGLIGGMNLVTARILDGRSELEVQAAIETVSGVEVAVLNYILESDASVGARSPVLDSRGGTPPFTLSDAELFANWPHYVMDTFPAHALADAVLGGSGLADVVLAVVDKGGFQTAMSTLASDSQVDSLLSDDSGDSDLSGRVVKPTGIVVDQETGVGTIQVGTRDVQHNRLIGTIGTSLHGLEVAAAAVGGGEDIIGTGRHVKLRPVKVSLRVFFGACTNDRTIQCDASTPCPEGMGSCDQGITTTDYLSAALTLLADDAASDLKVVNLSIGFDINDDAQRDRVLGILSVPIGKLIDDGRLVVVSAGNQGANTADRAFAVLGPTRGASRVAGGASSLQKGLVVVGGTSLPDGRIVDVLFEVADPTLDFSVLSEGHDPDAATGDHLRISAPSNFVPLLTGDFSTRRADGGTSFSAPYVAGLAAEMFAVDPSATNVEIIDIIERTADDLGASGPDEKFGFGRINCWKAILTLLNRNRPDDDPAWLGIRFRFALEADDTLQFSIGVNDGPDNAVPGATVRRVPDITQVMDDNSWAVPSPDFLPASVAAELSFETADLATNSAGVVVLKAATGSGSTVYEIPMRLSDLLAERPVDSSLDDYVLTLDIHTRSAAIYGRVMAEGDPVEGATIRYLSLDEQDETTLTDADGYYTIYDAMPDTEFELGASESDMIGDAVDITVEALTAHRQNFVLTDTDFPRTYIGTGTRTAYADGTFAGGSAFVTQAIDVEITFRENGTVSGVITSPDGEVSEVTVIGGEPGETATVIANRISVDITCPDDAPNNAGEIDTVVAFRFGRISWDGEWRENGTWDMSFRHSLIDPTISGSFSVGSISGDSYWPDLVEFPDGGWFSNSVCSHYESTVYFHMDWTFSGTISLAPTGE